MAEHYALARSKSALSTRADTLRELLRRVDVIPPSLVLAQGAIESGWGTSRFARQGNNLYGQRVWRSDLKGGDGERCAIFAFSPRDVRQYCQQRAQLYAQPQYPPIL